LNELTTTLSPSRKTTVKKAVSISPGETLEMKTMHSDVSEKMIKIVQ
jgi:hypothetical protein